MDIINIVKVVIIMDTATDLHATRKSKDAEIKWSAHQKQYGELERGKYVGVFPRDVLTTTKQTITLVSITLQLLL